MAEKNEYFGKNKKKSVFLKISEDFKIITHYWNPYREIRRNETDGLILEANVFLYWQAFAQWIINVLLNGIFLNFILFIWGRQPLTPLYVIGDGITVYFIAAMLRKLWDGCVDGLSRVARSHKR